MLGLVLALLMPVHPALACGGFSPPRTVTIEGSSFGSALSVLIESSCSHLKLHLLNRAESGASAETSLAHFTITKAQSTCASDGRGTCTDNATVPVRVGNRVVAIIETNSTEGILYSVNRAGNKDETKPYLKISKNPPPSPNGVRVYRSRFGSSDTLGEVLLQAFDEGEQVGEMRMDGGPCGLRGAGGAAQDGELELSGHRYVAESGCGGSSLTQQPFTASPAAPAPASNADDSDND